MSIRQITVIGTGLIGGSFALALKKHGFRGRIVGCDRQAVLTRAEKSGAFDDLVTHPVQASRSSHLALLATPVLAIIDLITKLAPTLPEGTLLADVGSTKSAIMDRANAAFGNNSAKRFLGGHPMAGKEQCGIEFADPDLFQGATWFVTPSDGQSIHDGLCGEYLVWIEKIGARIVSMSPPEHDELVGWISHVPQMISTALAATLVDEYGADAPLLDTAGRALREMTRVSSSPYSMWRDVAISNKDNISAALLKLEQRLAHIRENLDTRQLADEFETARQLRNSVVSKKHG
jgi:prephenate dehydrogenase